MKKKKFDKKKKTTYFIDNSVYINVIQCHNTQ